MAETTRVRLTYSVVSETPRELCERERERERERKTEREGWGGGGGVGGKKERERVRKRERERKCARESKIERVRKRERERERVRKREQDRERRREDADPAQASEKKRGEVDDARVEGDGRTRRGFCVLLTCVGGVRVRCDVANNGAERWGTAGLHVDRCLGTYTIEFTDAEHAGPHTPDRFLCFPLLPTLACLLQLLPFPIPLYFIVRIYLSVCACVRLSLSLSFSPLFLPCMHEKGLCARCVLCCVYLPPFLCALERTHSLTHSLCHCPPLI